MNLRRQISMSWAAAIPIILAGLFWFGVFYSNYASPSKGGVAGLSAPLAVIVIVSLFLAPFSSLGIFLGGIGEFRKHPVLFIGIVTIGLSPLLFFSHPITHPTRNTKGPDQNQALMLRSAISAYFTEYRKYPVEHGQSRDGDLLSDHKLMDVLLGSGKSAEKGGLNPRRIAFFAGRKAKPMSDGRYRQGINVDVYGGGELWDSWGNYYHVRIDLDLNNQVAEPGSDKSKTVDMIPQSVIVWSAGKDEIEGTSDDVKTW